MLLEEYDEKAEREYLRKEAIAMGLAEGKELGLTEGKEIGMAQEREDSFEIFYGMIQDGILSAEQLAERTGERKAEFLEWYEKRRMK